MVHPVREVLLQWNASRERVSAATAGIATPLPAYSPTQSLRLFFHYPTDASLLAVSAQYLVGDAILVTPVLEPNVSSVSGLFPAGATTIWRDWWSHEVLNTSTISEGSAAANVTLPAPLGHIPIHIRGGSILLLYAEAKYTTVSFQIYTEYKMG